MPSAVDETLNDRVIEGERITPEEALELYHLPLEELGALADHRRKLALAAHGALTPIAKWLGEKPEKMSRNTMLLTAQHVEYVNYNRKNAISKN